jgi:peptide/nickel transport system permease protein
MIEFLSRNRLVGAAVAILLVLLLSAIFAPWLVQYDPAAQDLPARLDGPSWDHPFGTDELGRDILSRILMGSRVSLRVGAMVVMLSVLVGVSVGGAAGFIGGRFDTVVNVLVINSLLAFPSILLAIGLVAFLGPGLDNLILALSVVGWVGYARMARGQVLKIKGLEFVEAARALGATRMRVFLLHVLPNIVQPIMVQASIGMAAMILAEATLSFLGLGIAPPTPSWGSMLSEARSHLFDAPHMVVFPSLVLMATVLSFNSLGDAIRDWLDPKSVRTPQG